MPAVPISSFLARGRARVVYSRGYNAGKPYRTECEVEMDEFTVHPEAYYFDQPVLLDMRIRQQAEMRIALFLIEKAKQLGCTDIFSFNDWTIQVYDVEYARIGS